MSPSRLTREGPSWRGRSIWKIKPGRWKMRNGQIAIVKEVLKIPYIDSKTKKEMQFLCWKGACECCNAPMTWNVNGTFGASRRHEFDIIGRAK